MRGPDGEGGLAGAGHPVDGEHGVPVVAERRDDPGERVGPAGEVGDVAGQAAGGAAGFVARLDRGEQQRHVAVEDPPVQLDELGARFDAELLGEHGPPPAEHGEGVGAPAGPGERGHQVTPELLVVRIPFDQVGDLGEDLLGRAEPQLQVEAERHRGGPLLLEMGGGRADRIGVDIREGPAAPQRERGPQLVTGDGEITVGGRGPATFDPAGEERGVELVGADLDAVPRRLGDHQLLGQSHPAEQLAEPGDAAVHLGPRRGRRVGVPQRRDHLLERHQLTLAQEQQSEEDAFTRRRNRDLGYRCADLHRPQDRKSGRIAHTHPLCGACLPSKLHAVMPDGSQMRAAKEQHGGVFFTERHAHAGMRPGLAGGYSQPSQGLLRSHSCIALDERGYFGHAGEINE